MNNRRVVRVSKTKGGAPVQKVSNLMATGGESQVWIDETTSTNNDGSKVIQCLRDEILALKSEVAVLKSKNNALVVLVAAKSRVPTVLVLYGVILGIGESGFG